MTVPVELDPPIRVVGFTVTDVRVGLLISYAARPEKIICPQPVTVSHPVPALDALPLGRVPLLPLVMSLKMDELPLKE